MNRNKIHTMLCVPGPYAPANERHILARVIDGSKVMFFHFGRESSKRTIMEKIPILVGEYNWKFRNKKGA